MAVSPNGDRLATISISGQLTIWNLPSLTVMKTCLPDELVQLQFSYKYCTLLNLAPHSHGLHQNLKVS